MNCCSGCGRIQSSRPVCSRSGAQLLELRLVDDPGVAQLAEFLQALYRIAVDCVAYTEALGATISGGIPAGAPDTSPEPETWTWAPGNMRMICDRDVISPAAQPRGCAGGE